MQKTIWIHLLSNKIYYKKNKLVDDKEKVIGLKNNIDLLQRQIKDRIISNIEPSVLVFLI